LIVWKLGDFFFNPFIKTLLECKSIYLYRVILLFTIRLLLNRVHRAGDRILCGSLVNFLTLPNSFSRNSIGPREKSASSLNEFYARLELRNERIKSHTSLTIRRGLDRSIFSGFLRILRSLGRQLSHHLV